MFPSCCLPRVGGIALCAPNASFNPASVWKFTCGFRKIKLSQKLGHWWAWTFVTRKWYCHTLCFLLCQYLPAVPCPLLCLQALWANTVSFVCACAAGGMPRAPRYSVNDPVNGGNREAVSPCPAWTQVCKTAGLLLARLWQKVVFFSCFATVLRDLCIK